MRHMRKLLALVLAVMMVMSLATYAFAADGDPTITVPVDDHTYEVYQIFTGDLHEGVLSNVVWGENGTGYVEGAETPVDGTILTELEGVAAASDADKLAVITKYVNLNTTPVATLAGDTLSATVAPGYYLIKDKDNSVSGNDSYTTYIVRIVESVSITRKADVPEVEKKILDPNEVDVNEAAIGEDVKYQITGTLPDNIADYKEYFYRFNDTLSAGLTYNNDAVVTVNGVDVTKYFYINASTYSETDGTTITVAIQDLLALENLTTPSVGDITKSTEVVITYTAKLNENAVINGSNPNEVDLDYSNNPNDSGEGTPGTPPENPSEPTPTEPIGKAPGNKVETFVTEVHIEKVDENLKALTGATFEITGTALKTVIVSTEAFTEDENGTYWKLTDGTYTTTDPATENIDQTKYESTTVKYSVTVNETVIVTTEAVKAQGAVGEDGKVTFTGLTEGEYVIKEIVTPAGYNTIADINLKVEFDEETKTFTYTWSGSVTGTGDTIQVVNQSGVELPSTGGIGNTIFYVLGGILVLAAVVLLVTKKRMSV